MTDFNATSYPTARNAHRCDECRRAITPGERYSRTAAVWEGDFFTNVACLHCAVSRMIVDYADDWYSEGYYSGLAEWLGDHWYDAVWSARLKVGLDRMWQRFDGAGLASIPTVPWESAESLHLRTLKAIGCAA